MVKVVFQLRGRSQSFDFRSSPPPRPYQNYPGSPAIYSRSGYQELAYWLPIWAAGTEVFLRNPPSNDLSIWTDGSGRFVNASAYPTLSDGNKITEASAASLPAGFGANDWFVDIFFHMTVDYEETPRPADKWGVIHSHMLRRRREIIGAQLPGGPSKYLAVLPLALRSMSGTNQIMPVFMRQYAALMGEQVGLPAITPVNDFTLFPSRAYYQANDVHAQSLTMTYQGREMALQLVRRMGLSERSGPNPRIVAAWRDSPSNKDIWIAIRHARGRRILPSKPNMVSVGGITLNNLNHGIQASLELQSDPWVTTYSGSTGFVVNSEVFDRSQEANGITKIRFTFSGASIPNGQVYLNYGKSWPRGQMSLVDADGPDGQYGWLMMELSQSQTYLSNRAYGDLLAPLSSEPAGVFMMPVTTQFAIPVQASDPGSYPGDSVTIDGDPATPTGDIVPMGTAVTTQSGGTRTVEATYSVVGSVPRVSTSVLDGSTRLVTRSSVPAGGQAIVTLPGVTPGTRRVGHSRVVSGTSASFTVSGSSSDFILDENDQQILDETDQPILAE